MGVSLSPVVSHARYVQTSPRFVMFRAFLVFSLFCIAQQSYAMGQADPALVFINFSRAELQQVGRDDIGLIEANGWWGTSAHKLAFGTEIERTNGVTDELEWSVGYQRPVSPFWDVIVGVKHQEKPNHGRTWAAITFSGLSYGFVETKVSGYLAKNGVAQLELEAHKTLKLDQNNDIVLEVTGLISSKDDDRSETGQGLSEIEAVLRYQYNLTRQIKPYVGYRWLKTFGGTKDLAIHDGEDVQVSGFIVGISAWF